MRLYAYYVGGDAKPQLTEADNIGKAAQRAYDVFGHAVHQVRPATDEEKAEHERLLRAAYAEVAQVPMGRTSAGCPRYVV